VIEMVEDAAVHVRLWVCVLASDAVSVAVFGVTVFIFAVVIAFVVAILLVFVRVVAFLGFRIVRRQDPGDRRR